MIIKVRNLLLISIATALAAFGMITTTLYLFQLEINDFTVYINGITAATVLCATFIGIALYTFISAMKIIFIGELHSPLAKAQSIMRS